MAPPAVFLPHLFVKMPGVVTLDQRGHAHRHLRFPPPAISRRLHEPDCDVLHECSGGFSSPNGLFMSHKIHEGFSDTRVGHQRTHGWIKHSFQTVGFGIDAHAGPSWWPLCWPGLLKPTPQTSPQQTLLGKMRPLFSDIREVHSTRGIAAVSLASKYLLPWLSIPETTPPP